MVVCRNLRRRRPKQKLHLGGYTSSTNSYYYYNHKHYIKHTSTDTETFVIQALIQRLQKVTEIFSFDSNMTNLMTHLMKYIYNSGKTVFGERYNNPAVAGFCFSVLYS